MLAKEFLYFKATVAAAMSTMRAFGVPASITLAQGAFESAWLQSRLAIKANNIFGIKAVPGEAYAEFDTTEFIGGVKQSVVAKFASYPTVADCFAAHARLLAMAQRYAPAMAVRHDPAQFAEQLQKCGYSTNPNYASGLMQLVKEFDLTQYDIQPEPPAQAKEQAA